MLSIAMDVRDARKGKRMYAVSQISYTDLMQEAIELAGVYLAGMGHAVSYRGGQIVPQAKIAQIAFDHLATVDLDPVRIKTIHADSLINTTPVRDTTINFEPNVREIVNVLGERVEAVCGKLRNAKKKEDYNLTLVLLIALVVYVQDVVLPAMPGAKVDVLSKIGQPRPQQPREKKE